MLDGISKNLVDALPVASTALFVGAGLFAGRKVCLGAGCKVAGAVANLLDSQSASDLDKMGDEYLSLAKKDAVRDLTGAAGLVAMGLTANYAADLLKQPEPEPEPDNSWTYGQIAAYGTGTLAALGFIANTAKGINPLSRLTAKLPYDLNPVTAAWKGAKYAGNGIKDGGAALWAKVPQFRAPAGPIVPPAQPPAAQPQGGN